MAGCPAQRRLTELQTYVSCLEMRRPGSEGRTRDKCDVELHLIKIRQHRALGEMIYVDMQLSKKALGRQK